MNNIMTKIHLIFIIFLFLTRQNVPKYYPLANISLRFNGLHFFNFPSFQAVSRHLIFPALRPIPDINQAATSYAVYSQSIQITGHEPNGIVVSCPPRLPVAQWGSFSKIIPYALKIVRRFLSRKLCGMIEKVD